MQEGDITIQHITCRVSVHILRIYYEHMLELVGNREKKLEMEGEEGRREEKGKEKRKDDKYIYTRPRIYVCMHA